VNLGFGFGLGLVWFGLVWFRGRGRGLLLVVLGGGRGKDALAERGYAMGAVRAQAYGPPTGWRGAQGSVPSMYFVACGPNCARTAPIASPLGLGDCARCAGGGMGGLEVPARGRRLL